MAESLSLQAGDLSLPELFQKGWDTQKEVESGELPSNSKEFQPSILTGIQALESATHMANQLSLFSANEEVDEITTTNLKYLLLPALLGDLTLQVTEGNRLETIRRARVYLLDYLQRCKSYAITAEDPPPLSTPSPAATAATVSLQHMASERTAKIARFKAQKEMEKKVKELTEQISSGAAGHSVDEELVREHALTLLRWWVFKCQDYVRSIDQETELLENMEYMRHAPGRPVARQPEQAPPTHRQPPVLIIREKMKSKVFGAGYPSLPTMMVEEFFEQKYKEQVEAHKSQDHTKTNNSHKSGEDEEREEEETEEEEAEKLQKEREWDEFKDDHRRGWGNRKNMG